MSAVGKFFVETDSGLREVPLVGAVSDGGLAEGTPDAIRPGYASIDDMLAGSPFYIAHRGGSGDWDEMTLRAYTNSVAWGAGALEVSLARTSDGVYFGLHDEFLDRTSLGTNTSTLNPKNMTWAQVQQYDVFGRQPYMRLEEVVEAYGGSHVLFLDPKFVVRNTAESRNHFFNTVKSLVPSWQESVVIKLFWNFNSDWGAAAKVAGFKTWGYLWHNDGYSQIIGTPANHANFDYLGFNYDAPASNWTSLAALGKPIIGHVCPDESAALTALGNGAVGVMAAGVRSIIPPKINWSN